MNSRQDDYRMRMIRAGLCVNCGKERLVTATRCEKCRKRLKLLTAKWRIRIQAEKLKIELERRKGLL